IRKKAAHWNTAEISFFQSPVPRVSSLIGFHKAMSSFRHFDFMSPSYCYHVLPKKPSFATSITWDSA
ncbi:hypothetical protein MMJ09_26255, partial [Bacillus vallismortis]|nr:hypothetical protein [Bacillus vallismortis]